MTVDEFVRNYPEESLKNWEIDYFGYPKEILKEMIAIARTTENQQFGILDDYALQGVQYLRFELNVPYENITILLSNKDNLELIKKQFSFISCSIHYIEDEELLEKGDNNNMLIIMNPPYGKSSSLAKEIIKSVLPISTEVVCLAPVIVCKYKEVLSKCKKVEICGDSNTFNDATTGTLAILNLSKEAINETEYEDLILKGLDEKLQTLRKAVKEYNKKHSSNMYCIDGNVLDKKFRMNLEKASKQQLPESFKDIANENVKDLLYKGYAFYNTVRSVVDGVHFTDPALDRDYNFRGIWNDENNFTRHGDLLMFATPDCRNNFRDWWYSCTKKYSTKTDCNRRGLTNALLTLLRDVVSCSAGICYYVDYFPHLDWSRPWTDREILKEIGLPEDFLED